MSSVPEDIAKQIKKAASLDEAAVAKYLAGHPNPVDEDFHAWAEGQGFDVDKTEAMAYCLATTHAKFLEGGRAKDKKLAPTAADQEQLRMGVEVEQEHTPDEATAQRIALDHLAEIPDYYTRLKEMEAGAKKTLDTSTAADGKTASEKPIHARNGTMKLSQLSALLQKAAAQETPAQKAKVHKVMGEFKRHELRRGKGSKPGAHGGKVMERPQAVAIAMREAGIPKKSEDQLVQALQQVKLAQALKEAQFSPEQAEILKQVLPDLVTPGSTGWGGLKGTLGGGALGALLGIPLGPSGVAGGAGLGAGIGGLGGAVAGGLRGRKKARKAVEHASGESEEKPKKKEKEDVSEKESQAFMIGFLAKCAEAGCTAQELEKIAVNWQAVLEALKNFGGGAATAPKNLFISGLNLARGGGGKSLPLVNAPAGTAGRAGEIAGMGVMGLGALMAAMGAGRASAPPQPQTLGEKLRALV